MSYSDSTITVAIMPKKGVTVRVGNTELQISLRDGLQEHLAELQESVNRKADEDAAATADALFHDAATLSRCVSSVA
jgi:hypothetical protein